MVQILRFAPAAPRSSDWTQREIAEFYRVESALTQAGVALDIERGLSDEGDPWFTFCRQDNGEVFIHFARIDGEYVIDGTGFTGIARGRDFATLIRTLISGEALQLAKLRPANSNVFLHPAALLIALVGAAFFHSSETKAAEHAPQKPEARRATGFSLVFQDKAPAPTTVGLDAAQAATLMAGILIGIDEQRMLPAPATLPAAALAVAVESPATLLAAETTHSQPSRAAIVLDSSAPAPNDPQLLSAQTMLPNVAPATDLQLSADSGLARIAALMLPAAPANIALSEMTSAPPPSIAQRPYFIAADMTASADALPTDEAGQVVRALSAGADPHAVSLTGKLPALMEDLIKHGSQIAPSPETPALSQIATAAGTTGPISLGPLAAAPAASPAAPSHDPAIDQAVTAFMNTVPHWGVVVNGEELVIYDEDIFGPHTGALDSVTFTFSDGSSVSLVGTVAELASSHLLH